MRWVVGGGPTPVTRVSNGWREIVREGRKRLTAQALRPHPPDLRDPRHPSEGCCSLQEWADTNFLTVLNQLDSPSAVETFITAVTAIP